jgi:NADPH:quinone reductase-like Zn-dependent oxidoreductase
MRSIIYHQYGEPAEVLRLSEVPDLPAPAEGEVLIRVHSRPVHPGDLLGIRGRYRAPGNTSPVGPDGARPGFEGVGVIEAVGAGVGPALAPGMRVAFFPARWAWSDKVLAPARYVTAIPERLPDALAAQLHVAPLTAALLLRAVQDVGARPGDVIALSAARGLVARLTSRLLLAQGYVPVGLVRSEETSQSSSMRFVSTGEPDWEKRIFPLTQGKPIKVALDAVGGKVASTLASLLADGGSLISYGDLSGVPLEIPALLFSTRGIGMRGVSVGRWPALPDAVRAADLASALSLAQSEPDLFRVAAEYQLAQIADAVVHAERPGKDGAVLLI